MVRKALVGSVAVWVTLGSAQAQNDEDPYTIELRNRTIATDAKSVITMPVGHAMVQFNEGTLEAGIDAIIATGASIVTGINDVTVLANFPADAEPIVSDDLRWIEPIMPEDKISTRMTEKGVSQFALVHLHSDVTPAEGNAMLDGLGVTPIAHEDLLKGTYLVEEEEAMLQTLAEQDEVSWIEPAPSALVNGQPLMQCGGGHTEFGPGAKFVANDDGWDGPGLGSAFLGFNTDGLSADHSNRAIESLNDWASFANLYFSGTAFDSTKSLDIFWQDFDSGHFDSHNVFAVGYFPANQETIAGDIMFNATDWANLNSDDFYSIVLHEIGHALGLNHSEFEGTVMYAFYQLGDPHNGLTNDDVAGIRSIYASDQPGADQGGDDLGGCASSGSSNQQSAHLADIAVILIAGVVVGVWRTTRMR